MGTVKKGVTDIAGFRVTEHTVKLPDGYRIECLTVRVDGWDMIHMEAECYLDNDLLATVTRDVPAQGSVGRLQLIRARWLDGLADQLQKGVKLCDG